MKRHMLIPGMAIAGALLCAGTAHAQTTIVSESFGGLGTDPLNGTAADTFSGGITAAGGSGTWVARTGPMQFNADGSISTSGTADGTAYLNLGDYIDNTKGTAAGIFELQATIGDVTSGNWVGIGFMNVDSPLLAQMFADFLAGTGTGDTGLAWAGHNVNTNDVAFYFAGPGDNGNSVPTGPTVALTPGAHTLTVFLDLSTHNGIDDFGTVSYAVDGNPVVGSEFSYTEDQSFRTIAIAQDNGGNGTVSDFTLTQVPEPGSLALLTLGGLALLRRR